MLEFKLQLLDFHFCNFKNIILLQADYLTFGYFSNEFVKTIKTEKN